jgi:hypothetical protein
LWLCQGGDTVCKITCNASISILQLKTKVEVEAGLKAATLAIYLPEATRPLGQTVTLADCELPSMLIAFTLHKIVIADMVGVCPDQLTDVQLAEACSQDEGKAGDIVDLAGCGTIHDVDCLVRLEQMQELDISGCTNIDATKVAKVVAESETLSKFTFSGVRRPPSCVTMETSMVEANFSNKYLGASGAIMLSTFLPKCT